MAYKELKINSLGIPNMTKQEFTDAINRQLVRFLDEMPRDCKTYISIANGEDWEIIRDNAVLEQQLCKGTIKTSRYLRDVCSFYDKFYARHLKAVPSR